MKIKTIIVISLQNMEINLCFNKNIEIQVGIFKRYLKRKTEEKLFCKFNTY